MEAENLDFLKFRPGTVPPGPGTTKNAKIIPETSGYTHSQPQFMPKTIFGMIPAHFPLSVQKRPRPPKKQGDLNDKSGKKSNDWYRETRLEKLSS